MKMKFNYSRADVITMVKNTLLILLGTVILAVGVGVFMVPFNIVAGGVSGVAIALDMVIPFEFVTVDLLVMVLNWALFIVGFIILGKNFTLKSLVSAIAYPPLLALAMKLASPDVLGGYFYLAESAHGDIALIIAALVGGALVGVGCAVTYFGGGSTGGTDIIAFVICKFFPRLKSSKVIFYVDASVVLLGVFIVRDMILSLLGIVAAIVGAILIDKVFLGGSKSFIAQIITEKHEELRLEVIDKLKRGATVIDVVGGYTGVPRKMLLVSFKISQYNEILNAINKIDKMAFVTVHRAHEINGEGWTR